MPRNGKTLRQRYEALGFDNPDTDERAHDALDALEQERSKTLKQRFEESLQREAAK